MAMTSRFYSQTSITCGCILTDQNVTTFFMRNYTLFNRFFRRLWCRPCVNPLEYLPCPT